MNIYPISKPSSKNRISDSLSPWEHFGNRCQAHLNHLVEFRFEIDSIEQIFDEDQLWSDQIEEAVNSFKCIQVVTGNLPKLFRMENQAYLPNKDCRYRVIVNSQYIHHQLLEAIDLAIDMEIGGKFSKKATQKNIKYILSKIRTNLDDLIKDIEYSIP